MARYIDADKAVERLRDICAPYEESREVKDEAIEIIADFPTADVAEVKHAKWECVDIDYDVRYNMVTMWCPICEKWHSEAYCYGNPTENINYCSHCGAKMDLKEE